VQIDGANFPAGRIRVDFGDDILVDSVTFRNSSTINAVLLITDSAAIGPRTISVENTRVHGAVAALRDGFSVLSEALTSVTNGLNSATDRHKLDEAFPNPFNSRTVIGYQLSEASYVTLRVFDLLGREVASLVNEERDVVVHRVWFDASGVMSGVYVFHLVTESLISHSVFVASRKIVVLK